MIRRGPEFSKARLESIRPPHETTLATCAFDIPRIHGGLMRIISTRNRAMPVRIKVERKNLAVSLFPAVTFAPKFPKATPEHRPDQKFVKWRRMDPIGRGNNTVGKTHTPWQRSRLAVIAIARQQAADPPDAITNAGRRESTHREIREWAISLECRESASLQNHQETRQTRQIRNA